MLFNPASMANQGRPLVKLARWMSRAEVLSLANPCLFLKEKWIG